MSFHISFTLLSGYMIKPVFDIKMEDAYQAVLNTHIMMFFALDLDI